LIHPSSQLGLLSQSWDIGRLLLHPNLRLEGDSLRIWYDQFLNKSRLNDPIIVILLFQRDDEDSSGFFLGTGAGDRRLPMGGGFSLKF